LYTIRSAYNLARTESFFVARSRKVGGMSWGSVNEEKQWKTIWKINAPGKMKIHLWRFAHDCLPSGVQMRRRKIPTSDSCVFYGREEDIEHSMLLCQFAQEVWRTVKASFNIQLQRRHFMSPKQWLFEFLANATKVEATILAVGCWHIWEARNDARNNQDLPNPSHTSARIIAYVDLIIQHCFKTKSGNRRETSQATRWSPPPPGVVMVNSDVALFEDCRRMAMGALIRDNAGTCLAAASLPLPGFTDPELGEAIALQSVVKITYDKGYRDAIFVSDCLSLIQRLNSVSPDRSQVGALVKDIKTLVAGFISATFRHVRRSLNDPTHVTKTCNLASIGFIFNYAPNYIRKTLCIDVP
jgi:hypothetical protein